jgi:hypothetical protein
VYSEREREKNKNKRCVYGMLYSKREKSIHIIHSVNLSNNFREKIVVEIGRKSSKKGTTTGRFCVFDERKYCSLLITYYCY